MSIATGQQPGRHTPRGGARHPDWHLPQTQPNVIHLQRPVTATLATAGVPDAGALGTGQASARLRIHAGAESPDHGWRIDALLRHMRSLFLADGGSASARLDLEIHDLKGNQVLALEDAMFTIDVALAPGTYHVTALHCGAQRQYTVALAHGAVVDLHLRPRRDGV